LYDLLELMLIGAFLGEDSMDKWRCIPCDYIYDPAEGDPDSGIPPNTAFEDLPDDWLCPLCAVGKEEFEKLE
jgi:rubredoxin